MGFSKKTKAAVLAGAMTLGAVSGAYAYFSGTAETKSNVFNIVATFEQHGYLEKNKATGKYRLGLKLLEFSYLINENLGYQRVLYDIMKEVSNELGAITYFAVLRGQKVFYLCSAYPHKKDNHFPYRTIIGETAPLYCTSLGKVMMAFMPSEELEAYLTQSVSFHTFTRYTITCLLYTSPSPRD